jgi:hypothetical protein
MESTPAVKGPLAGLVPTTHSSGGKTSHGRMLPFCNRWLKWAFIEAAWVAIGCSGYFGSFYKRHRARGKGANEVITLAGGWPRRRRELTDGASGPPGIRFVRSRKRPLAAPGKSRAATSSRSVIVVVPRIKNFTPPGPPRQFASHPAAHVRRMTPHGGSLLHRSRASEGVERPEFMRVMSKFLA